jgi:hypothetical protein
MMKKVITNVHVVPMAMNNKNNNNNNLQFFPVRRRVIIIIIIITIITTITKLDVVITTPHIDAQLGVPRRPILIKISSTSTTIPNNSIPSPIPSFPQPPSSQSIHITIIGSL